jgi:hypothetical protein
VDLTSFKNCDIYSPQEAVDVAGILNEYAVTAHKVCVLLAGIKSATDAIFRLLKSDGCFRTIFLQIALLNATKTPAQQSAKNPCICTREVSK